MTTAHEISGPLDQVAAAEAARWEEAPAAQQPQWYGHPDFPRIRRRLAAEPAMVSLPEIDSLSARLSEVATGVAQLLQVGDCAESFGECSAANTGVKVATLDLLGDELCRGVDADVVRIGRIGGQFAKPRSSNTERHGDIEIPAFRGHMVNSEVPTEAARQHDPGRLLCAYEAGSAVLRWLRQEREMRSVAHGPWSSHEALVMDYESNLVRVDPDTGSAFLGSTHFPWIGERTRDPDAAHVRLLAAMANPVGCKIGPTATATEVLRLCELLDPDRIPGRLTFISRMGKHAVGTALPPIVEAVRRAGHPVVWLVDPMHGNTVKTEQGVKTRYLGDIAAEALAFKDILRGYGVHPAGLHLEVAAEEVTECVGASITDEGQLYRHYTTLCDPRLNPDQARELVGQWAGH